MGTSFNEDTFTEKEFDVSTASFVSLQSRDCGVIQYKLDGEAETERRQKANSNSSSVMDMGSDAPLKTKFKHGSAKKTSNSIVLQWKECVSL